MTKTLLMSAGGKLLAVQSAVDVVEPWFEDSFEGTPPDGWKEGFNPTWTPFHASDTTDAGGVPTGGGSYSYRQMFPPLWPTQAVAVDPDTDVFTCEDHGYVVDTPVRLIRLNDEGVFPTGIDIHTPTMTHVHYIRDVTQHTFKLRRYTAAINLTDAGTAPFYVQREHYLGQLTYSFPEEYRVYDGDDISWSFYLKYKSGFDFGTASGNKHWSLDGPGGEQFRMILQWPDEMKLSVAYSSNAQSLDANVNGGIYVMPAGEWVKMDFYLKVSEDVEGKRNGIIKCWINNVLRWDYSNRGTLMAGKSYYKSWIYWAQVSSGPALGEGQERYLDLFRIGPGNMVLSEQGEI